MNYISSFNVEKLGYGQTFLHKLNPFSKLFILITSYIILFNVNLNVQLIGIISLIILLIVVGFKFRKLIYIFILLILPLLSFYILLLLIDYDNKALTMFIISLRMLSLFLPVVLYSCITPLKESVFVISKLLKPLEKISISFTNLAILSLTIVITYFPILLMEFDNVLLIKAARGEDIKEANFINKIKIIYSSLFPVLVNSFIKAEQMVDAIIIRRFNKDIKRSSYISYSLNLKDLIIIIILLLVSTISIFK